MSFWHRIDAVEAAVTPDLVAVRVEPVQGEAGVVEAEAGFLPALPALTLDQRDLAQALALLDAALRAARPGAAIRG